MRSEFLVSSTGNVLHRLTINKVSTIFIKFQVFHKDTSYTVYSRHLHFKRSVVVTNNSVLFKGGLMILKQKDN